MAIFRRKQAAQRIDPDERSPQLGLKYKDLAVLGALMERGVDLTQPREVIEHCYAPSRLAGEALAAEIEGLGFTVEVSDPLPAYPGQWAVVATTVAVVDPVFVRDTGDTLDALVATHGCIYDGWEAAVTSAAQTE